MRYPSPLLEGTLLRRYKRFLADVELDDGTTVTAACPNTGSMLSCSDAGSRCRLSVSDAPTRKYPHTLEQVRAGRTWVAVNTALPNRLVHEALVAGRLAEIGSYPDIRPEIRFGTESRLDFLLERPGERCYVEVKGVSLVLGGRALFPDAVSTRGLKHVRELLTARRAGDRAVLLFVVQRADGRTCGPADEIHPEYGVALREAAAAGVEVVAYRARVRRHELVLDGATVPIAL